jgi:CRISPR-associated protein Cmr2
MPKRLYFSIGPVQGFVAQSRRTRDLWTSSYLLSSLARAAMDAVVSSGGRILLPAYSELASNASPERPPHGNLPNRFVAEGSGPAFDPVQAAESATQAFRGRWKDIAEAVCNEYLAPIFNQGNGTPAIWERQVNNFWEPSWAVGSADDDPLPRRKKWRTSPATIEPGDHCSMMGQWQELSGFIRSTQRVQQDQFWQAVREQTKELDLNPDERLCAIALIKRLFPRVAGDALGQNLNAENWPSTPYLAAIPWLKRIGEEGNGLLDEARAYAQKVRNGAEQPLGERYTRMKSLVELSEQKSTGDLFRLDGNFFHERALRNERVTPLKNQAERQDLLKALKAIEKKAGAASSFYALLLMDGDSMGELLSLAREQGKEQDVTTALTNFARAVPSIVEQHDGVVVYAGGDDLLALLPHDRALDCATALSDDYQKSFESCGKNLGDRATISGTLLYCDYHLPLRTILQSAHDLLDNMAKDAAGRDSLAIAVWKGSGLAAKWAAPWEHLRRGDGNLLQQLAAKLRPPAGDTGRSQADFSSSFLYRLRELFASLTDDPLEEPGSFGTVVQDVELQPLLLAEYLQGLSHRLTPEEAGRQRAEAEDNIQQLLKVCFRVTREGNHKNGTAGTDCRVGFDGLRLVHFLAAIGKEAES